MKWESLFSYILPATELQKNCTCLGIFTTTGMNVGKEHQFHCVYMSSLQKGCPLSSLTHQATSITCHSCLALGLSSTTSTGWRGHTPWGGHLARSYTGREAVWHRASLVSSPLFLFKFCLEGKIGPGDIEGHSCQLPLHHNPCDIKVRSV